jgi:hypothetical protein
MRDLKNIFSSCYGKIRVTKIDFVNYHYENTHGICKLPVETAKPNARVSKIKCSIAILIP